MRERNEGIPSAEGRMIGAAATLAALAYVLFADYEPLALAAVLCLIFAGYVWIRVLVYWENDRFTPKRYRVGFTWALIGIDPDTEEFDARPAQIYFVILLLLFAGLLVRPGLRLLFLSTGTDTIGLD